MKARLVYKIRDDAQKIMSSVSNVIDIHEIPAIKSEFVVLPANKKTFVKEISWEQVEDTRVIPVITLWDIIIPDTRDWDVLVNIVEQKKFGVHQYPARHTKISSREYNWLISHSMVSMAVFKNEYLNQTLRGRKIVYVTLNEERRDEHKATITFGLVENPKE